MPDIDGTPDVRCQPPHGVARALARTVTSIVLLALVAVLLLLLVPRAMGYHSLIVRSGSMTGTADTGSLVLARPEDAATVDVGDVILIRREREGRPLAPVLHRVISRQVNPEGEVVVRTKGDANAMADEEPYIVRGQTLQAVLVLPSVGRAVALAQTPLGWFGLVIFPLVLSTSVALVRLWSDTDPETDALEPSAGATGDPRVQPV